MNGLYEAAVIILLFPLILGIGAGSEIKNEKLKSVCKFLGFISYPLYITHIAYIDLLWAFKGNNPDAPTSTVICVCICFYLLSIGTAYAALKLFDIPVREWLKRHWLHKR